MKKKILKHYKEWGYIHTTEYLRGLSINGKITLVERTELQDMITEIEIIPKRKRK